MPSALVLACKEVDFNATTGECAAPFYTYPPGAFPELTWEEGAEIAFAIVVCWTAGLVARLIIRSMQTGRYDNY